MVGRTVVGRFRIERIIGRGGMACVYAAFDERSGREVALKLLKRELTRDPTVLRRFEREAKAASHLLHPNIIQVYESGIQNEDAFIAMELANGKDLLKALSQQRPMRQTRAALVLAQVCAALDVAHAKGIVHRDLKPENIVLVPDPAEPGGERAKVLDFGIAKILDVSKPATGDTTDPPSYVTKTALTRVGTIVGTPAYMSPEQCRGGDLDGRSDIYTCGVLLYQLVTGELPFTGETPLHTAMRHIHAQPRPPHELRRDIHPALERIILKALAKWPGERHQTAVQLREELAACIPELPDRGDVVLPSEYLTARSSAPAPAPAPPPASEGEASPDSDPVQPTRMLVGGPLGRTPLRAVRLGGPSSTPTPEAARPGEPEPSPAAPPVATATAPAVPTRASKPPEAAAPVPSAPVTTPQPAEDDDEPPTFLMKPEDQPAAVSHSVATPGPKTEQKVAQPRADGPPATAAVPMTATPATPVKGSLRPTQASTRASNSAVAHAKTAPAGGPVAPGGISRPPARPEKSSRPPAVARPSTRAPEPPSPRAALKSPPSHTTETGLTPTNVTHVPSSNDPPTHRKNVDGNGHPVAPADPLAQTVAPSGSPQTLSPRSSVDDDEVSTGVREQGPPERQRGANQTLVMEEPSREGGAPPSAQHTPGRRGAEIAVGPTLLANQHGPTGAEIEAEALRAMKATARMPMEDPNTAAAGRSATLRMNQQQQERYSSPPASVQVNPAYAGGVQAVPPSSRVPNLAAPMTGPGGWNEATVSRRRPEISRPAIPKGVVGELASLPGTTGFLIGIGLGLGIAAGVVIALLVMR